MKNIFINTLAVFCCFPLDLTAAAKSVIEEFLAKHDYSDPEDFFKQWEMVFDSRDISTADKNNPDTLFEFLQSPSDAMVKRIWLLISNNASSSTGAHCVCGLNTRTSARTSTIRGHNVPFLRYA